MCNKLRLVKHRETLNVGRGFVLYTYSAHEK